MKYPPRFDKSNDCNVENRTIFCKDNLDILRNINSDCIDLVYLDPPFNKKKTFTAPIGTSAQGASFKDIFKREDVKKEWLESIEFNYPDIYQLIKAVQKIHKSNYNWCYLTYMAIRLIECHRVLKPTGSLYLHCDPTMSHYLKLLLDCIFEEKNFRNEIVWWYGGGGASKKTFGKKHDVILFYSKSDNWTFNVDDIREKYKWDKGQKRADGSARDLSKGKIPDDVIKLHGVMPWAKERTGYPTQKPLKLLERIIKASSDKGDIVLDPFCGCATTCVVAETLERQWIGIDISELAFRLVNERLAKQQKAGLLNKSWRFKKPFLRTDIPIRTDIFDDSPKMTYIEMKRKLYKNQNQKCNGCQLEFLERNLEIDHIHPRSRGGVDSIKNRQLLCGYCNRKKGNKSQTEFLASIKRQYQA